MSTATVGVIADTTSTGHFKRQPSKYRDCVKREDVTKGRFLLVVSYACPWACRCITVRHARGLDKESSSAFVPLLVVDPIFQPTRPEDPADEHRGWHVISNFDQELVQQQPDPVFGAKTVREIYEKDYYEHRGEDERKGLEPPTRFTVPILVDTKLKRIVNNESSDIMRMLDTEFGDQPPMFYPAADEKQRAAIDEWNVATYESLSNGVYKCGFATTQEAYDDAVDDLFKTLDMLEAHFSKHRFMIAGSARPLECDVRAVQTIVRFDSVYVQHFKLPGRVIRHDCPHVHAWMVDVVQCLDMYPLSTPASVLHYVNHYYRSHASINKFAIVPKTYVPDWTADVSSRQQLL